MTQLYLIEAKDLLTSPDTQPIYLDNNQGDASDLTAFTRNANLFRGNLFETAVRIEQELEHDKVYASDEQWQYITVPAFSPLPIKDQQ